MAVEEPAPLELHNLVYCYSCGRKFVRKRHNPDSTYVVCTYCSATTRLDLAMHNAQMRMLEKLRSAIRLDARYRQVLRNVDDLEEQIDRLQGKLDKLQGPSEESGETEAPQTGDPQPTETQGGKDDLEEKTDNQ